MTAVEIPAADSIAERYGRRHRRVEDHQPTTMDEALEAAEVIADSELEGAVVMLLRVSAFSCSWPANRGNGILK